MFKQNAFSRLDLIVQPLVSISIAAVFFKKVALEMGILSYMIVSVPTILDKPLFHAFKCITLSFITANVCLVGAVFIKYCFYKIIGMMYGCEPTTAMDDFWLYDLPINPINIPVALVVDKPEKNPEDVLKQFVKNQDRGHRSSVKPIKLFGKYFFKKLDDEEFAKWQKTNTGVVYDVKTEDELLEYMLKIKKVHTEKTDNSYQVYYVPSLNGDKEAAFILCGHHSLHDGFSMFQLYNVSSDNKGVGEYPFMKRPVPTLLQWLMIYLTIPISWYQGLSQYKSRPKDVNCIKKHKLYMTGKLRAKNALTVSMAKAKKLSHAKGVTFNDLMLAITSKALKRYFTHFGDTSEEVTVAMPFSFKSIP